LLVEPVTVVKPAVVEAAAVASNPVGAVQATPGNGLLEQNSIAKALAAVGAVKSTLYVTPLESAEVLLSAIDRDVTWSADTYVDINPGAVTPTNNATETMILPVLSFILFNMFIFTLTCSTTFTFLTISLPDSACVCQAFSQEFSTEADTLFILVCGLVSCHLVT
jgi:hypothetical protein